MVITDDGAHRKCFGGNNSCGEKQMTSVACPRAHIFMLGFDCAPQTLVHTMPFVAPEVPDGKT